MSREADLDRIAALSDESLSALVVTIEQAVMIGTGLLIRHEDGTLASFDTRDLCFIQPPVKQVPPGLHDAGLTWEVQRP